MCPASLKNSEEYLKRKALYEQFGYDLEAERQAIMDKAKKIGPRVLEVGTGKGYFTLALAKAGHDLTTVDISEEEQQYAQENISSCGLKKQVRFIVADAHHLPFEDKAFDAVLCVNSFHHMQNQFSVLREIIRVCDKPSKIVISDFNLEGFELIERIHQSEGRKHNFFEVCWEAISCFLEDQGFRVETSDTKYQKILFSTKL